MLLAVLAVHLIAIAGFSSLRATRFDIAKPATVTLLTLLSARSADSKLEPPSIPWPSRTPAFAPPLVPMPELVITSPAPATTRSVTIDDPCLRASADPAQAEADRRDCERRLQFPGGLHLDAGGNLVDDPAGTVRNAPEDKEAADRLAERQDLNLKAQFGGPEMHESPVDRERLPEIPIETWQKVEARNQDNQR
jgi:hypothetical protein